MRWATLSHLEKHRIRLDEIRENKIRLNEIKLDFDTRAT